MRLTDNTVVRQLRNGFLAVSEGTGVATLIRPTADNVFPCGDYYEGYPAFTYAADYDGDWFPESPSDLIQSCTATRVGFDNGSACTAGHSHFTDAEYYTEEEAHAINQAGHMLASNARMI